jgi:flagellar protein FlgJ
LTPYVNPVQLFQNATPSTPGLNGDSFVSNYQMANQALMSNTYMSHVPAFTKQAQLNPLHPVFQLNSSSTHSDAQMKKVSKDFEAIFMRMLLKEMRDSVQKSGLMGNSMATGFFESMQDGQLADHLASAGGIGLGSMVYRQLQKDYSSHQKIS